MPKDLKLALLFLALVTLIIYFLTVPLALIDSIVKLLEPTLILFTPSPLIVVSLSSAVATKFNESIELSTLIL